MGRCLPLFMFGFVLFAGDFPVNAETLEQTQSAVLQEEHTLTFAGDLWCPVNCDANSSHQGFAVDLLRKIFEPLGYKINYVVMPWVRAVEEANTGKINGVIGALKDDTPELLFPTTALTTISDDFYVLASSPLTYDGIQSLKGQFVGIIDGYSYSPIIASFLAESALTPGAVQSVSGEDAIEQNIRKLRAGRITVVIESSITMNYTLHQMRLTDQFKRIGGEESGAIFIAFSPAFPQSSALMLRFDEGMAKLRENGALAEIYGAYGVAP